MERDSLNFLILIKAAEDCYFDLEERELKLRE